MIMKRNTFHSILIILLLFVSCDNKNEREIALLENCIIDVKYEIDSITGLFVYKLVYELNISDSVLFNSIVDKEIKNIYISNLYEDDFTFLHSSHYYFLEDSNTVYFFQSYPPNPCFPDTEDKISKYIQHQKSILQLKIVNSMDSVWVLSTCNISHNNPRSSEVVK